MNLLKTVAISTLALGLVVSTAFAETITSGQAQAQEEGNTINSTGTSGAGSTAGAGNAGSGAGAGTAGAGVNGAGTTGAGAASSGAGR